MQCNLNEGYCLRKMRIEFNKMKLANAATSYKGNYRCTSRTRERHISPNETGVAVGAQTGLIQHVHEAWLHQDDVTCSEAESIQLIEIISTTEIAT